MSYETGIEVNDTESKIRAVFQDVLMMGANDTEPRRFEELIKRWKSGEFTDEEAIEEANRILASKQDYH